MGMERVQPLWKTMWKIPPTPKIKIRPCDSVSFPDVYRPERAGIRISKRDVHSTFIAA